jgi:hypothetical protein
MVASRANLEQELRGGGGEFGRGKTPRAQKIDINSPALLYISTNEKPGQPRAAPDMLKQRDQSERGTLELDHREIIK